MLKLVSVPPIKEELAYLGAGKGPKLEKVE
jgi:hypothetical protein